nr:uncharacterized protein LOC112038835 isoform X1 [Quercus suber]XP_023927457.1 uncharacterized protein LOC112038835 isoform X2 [Quercus suber]
MESKFLLRKEAIVSLDSRRLDHRETIKTPTPNSTSCSCSSFASSQCCDKTTECLCSACLLCVCCPLAVVWGCFKLPCKIGWRAAKHAKQWTCCGSGMKGFAEYSSFSDNDSDFQPSSTRTCSKSVSVPKKRVAEKANGFQSNKSVAALNSH